VLVFCCCCCCCYDKYLREKFKRGKIYFDSWFQNSVHGGLVPLLWNCGEAEHHGGKSVWQNKVPLLMVVRKQRETGGSGQKQAITQ
jgi:hypothetical protein